MASEELVMENRWQTGRTRRALLHQAVGIGMAAGLGTLSRSSAKQSDATPAIRVEPEPSGSSNLGLRVETEPDIATGSPARGGTIRLVRPGSDIANFNPAAFAQDRQIPLSYLEPLVRPNPETMAPEPWLADSWEWRDRGLDLRFVLRDGVKWHDGEALTADDAAFAFEVYQDDIDSAVSGFFVLAETIEAVSDREVRIRFRERDPNWLTNVATLPIFSRQQYEAFWRSQSAGTRTLTGFDWQNTLPVGTGPWRTAAWDEANVEFERFARYWGEPPWLDAMEVAVESGRHNRLQAWSAGNAALLWPVSAQRIAAVAETAGSLRPVPAASVMFAAFNFANPSQANGTIWADLRVRRAASLAIDRERYATEVFDGFIHWDAAGTIAQPWANDPEALSPEYSPQAAGLLLGEAGWIDYNGDGIREDVNGLPLTISIISRADSRPELASVLAHVVRDLTNVGMLTTVEVLSGDAFDARWIQQRDYDLIAYAYDLLPGFTDFDLYGSAWDIRTNPAGWNPGGYANAEADAAIEEFLGSLSVTRQASALRRLQRAVNEDLFGLWFGFPQDLVLVAEDVEGFVPDLSWQTAQTAKLWLRDIDI